MDRRIAAHPLQRPSTASPAPLDQSSEQLRGERPAPVRIDGRVLRDAENAA